MNIKNTLRSIIPQLLLIGSPMTVIGAVVPADGDVFLGIRNTTASSAYVLDLGSMDQFINAYNSKGSLTFNSISSSGLFSDLNSLLGTGWYNNSNVKFGLFGGFYGGSYNSAISTMPDNAIIVGNPSSGAVGNRANQTMDMLTGYTTGMADNAGSSTAAGNLSSSAWISVNGKDGAWDTYQYAGTPSAYNVKGSAAYGIFNGSVETQVANSLNVNSVFSSDASQNNGYIGNNIGTFNITSGGQVSFNAVPEPSTYALFGIGAIGLLMVLRRKKAV